MIAVLHLLLSLILAWNISAALPAFLKPRFKSRLSVFVRTALLYFICLFPIVPDFVQTYIVSYIFFLIYIFLFFNEEKEKNITFSVIFFSVIGSWSFLSSWWIKRIAGSNIPIGITTLIAILLIVLAFLYFSIFRVYFRQVADSMLLKFFTKRMWNYSTFIALSPSVIVLILVSSPPRNLVFLQMLTFFSIALSTVIFPLLYQMGRSAKLAEENSRLTARSEYYQGIEAQQQEIRKIKHDIMNHLTVVATYLDLGEYDKAMDYLKEIGTRFSGLTKQYTPSTLINAILNYKKQKAESLGIELDIKADITVKTDDTEIDLCTLISNTLDNAIEADPPDKKILLEMLDDGEKLLFSVTNRYEKKIEKNEDGSFISSKSDKQNHGLGIKSIEEAVARMNGKITVTAENGIFRVYAEVPTRK